MRRRGSSISVTVDADIEIDEILEELHDDDLKNECGRRGLYVNPSRPGSDANPKRSAFQANADWQDLEDDLRDAIRSQNAVHINVVLLRMRRLAGVPYMMTDGLKRDDQASLN